MKYPLLLLITIIALSSCSKQKPILKICLVADPQYANKSVKGKRHYKESLWKLREAIVIFNHNNVDFVQNLGDIIDDKWDSYDSINPIYQNLKSGIQNYHLLGNHDFAVYSMHLGKLLETLSMPDYYYSYVKKDWRFIVLDATDYSYFSNSLHEHDINLGTAYFNNTSESSNKHKYNSAIGKKQKKWLKQELDTAEILD